MVRQWLSGVDGGQRACPLSNQPAPTRREPRDAGPPVGFAVRFHPTPPHPYRPSCRVTCGRSSPAACKSSPRTAPPPTTCFRAPSCFSDPLHPPHPYRQPHTSPTFCLVMYHGHVYVCFAVLSQACQPLQLLCCLNAFLHHFFCWPGWLGTATRWGLGCRGMFCPHHQLNHCHTHNHGSKTVWQ